MAVFPSALSDTALVDVEDSAMISETTNLGPCWLQVSPLRVNTQAATAGVE